MKFERANALCATMIYRKFKATVRDLETRLRECAAMERTERTDLDLPEPRGPPDAATYTLGTHPALRGLRGAAEQGAEEDETGLTYRREGGLKVRSFRCTVRDREA